MARTAGTTTAAPDRTNKMLLTVSNLMILISSIITTGILSWFIKINGGGRGLGANIVYQEVISVLTMVIWLAAIVVPHVMPRYRGHFMPLNLIFSYLWLTSFIFTAQSWSRGTCNFNAPFGYCAYKHTVEAFTFLAFFFLVVNTVFDAYLAYRTRDTTGVVHKERPLSSSTHGTAPHTSAV